MGSFVNKIRAKLGLEPKRETTVTGSTPNEVVITRRLQEDVGFNMAGNPVPAIPTRAARDTRGKKSSLTDTPPPGDKGNIGYDSNLKTGSEKDEVELSRRRAKKRLYHVGYLESLDQIGGDMTQGPTAFPVTTSPVPTAKPKLKSFKKAIQEGQFTDVPGEQGSPNYGSDVDMSSSDTVTLRTEKKNKKLKEQANLDEETLKTLEAAVESAKRFIHSGKSDGIQIWTHNGKFYLNDIDYAKDTKKFKDIGAKLIKTIKKETKLDEATYKGKTVPLNKPMKGDVKKSKVYVDPDGDGKAQKVNFGDKNLSIKKNIPARKKSYCARSSGQGNLNDKTSANYWSRKAWNCEEIELHESTKPEVGSHHHVDEDGAIGHHVVTGVYDGIVYTQNVKTKKKFDTPLRHWKSSSSPIKEEVEIQEDEVLRYAGKSPHAQLGVGRQGNRFKKGFSQIRSLYRPGANKKTSIEREKTRLRNAGVRVTEEIKDIRGDNDDDGGFRGDLLKRGTRVRIQKDGYSGLGNIDYYDKVNRVYVVSSDHDGTNLVLKADEVTPIEESKNTPYVKPHFGAPDPKVQTAWKASNKHGKVKYFGLDFKKSAEKHAFKGQSLVEQVKSIMGTEE